MPERTIKKIRDKRGASLVITLAVMLCLLIISVSVLAAAASNAVYVNNQREHYELLLLDDSVQKNLMYSLQKDTSDPNLLSRQLVTALYEAHDAGGSLSDIELTPILSSGAIDCTVTLSFTSQQVDIRPEIPEIPPTEPVYDTDGVTILIPGTPGVPRVPKTASVDARMTATAVTTASGKTFTTTASYEYHGGALEDDVFVGYGEWSLTAYERADSRN